MEYYLALFRLVGRLVQYHIIEAHPILLDWRIVARDSLGGV